MVDILFEGIVVLIDCQAISFCLKIKFLRSEAPAEGSRCDSLQGGEQLSLNDVVCPIKRTQKKINYC